MFAFVNKHCRSWQSDESYFINSSSANRLNSILLSKLALCSAGIYRCHLYPALRFRLYGAIHILPRRGRVVLGRPRFRKILPLWGSRDYTMCNLVHRVRESEDNHTP